MPKFLSSVGFKLLIQVLTSSPIDAMEAAKEIIRQQNVAAVFLEEVASHRALKQWSRIAAIYALGYSGHRPSSSILLRILQDSTESSLIRSHSAEALGNIGDPKTIDAIRTLLANKLPRSVKRSCIYAMSQLGNLH